MIVENPEAHLHPKAQSNIGFFLGKMAGLGIQIIVETHSEHVINALRLCSLLPEYEGFGNKNLSMYFFDRNMTVKNLILEPDGQVSSWPLGFFDQAERDAARIIQLGLLK